MIAGGAPRFLQEFKDDAAPDRSEDLRRRDRHVVDAEDDARLVGGVVVVVIVGGGGAQAPHFLELADLGADDGEGRPEREGPGNADDADERGGAADAAHEER